MRRELTRILNGAAWAIFSAFCCWAGAASASELRVELDPVNREWMRREQSIRLLVDQLPSSDQGRLAILVGDTDLTDLFFAYGNVLEYRPAPLALPSGEYDITVFLVSPQGAWREVARLPIQVLTESGLERRGIESRIDLQGIQLLDEQLTPAGSPSSSGQDSASLNLHLGGDAQRAGWRLGGSTQFLGVSAQQNALRFAQRGEDAPLFDLSNYTVRMDRTDDPRRFFALGHVSYNQHRHLIPGFSSRGAVIGMPIGSAGSATFATMNGTSIAGWNNIIGLSDSDHRVTATTVGFELRPARPGALRFDADFLDGSLLPLNAFNGANIGDRQTNRAWGARVAGSTPSGVLRLEAGFARSAFDNPNDPSLAQGLTLVEVAREERSSRYADVYWTILQGRPIGKRHAASLALTLRHELVDPQFATIAASLQSDVLRNSVQLAGSIGPIQVQAAYTQLEDNLDDIATILTTHTRRTDALIAASLAELFGTDRGAKWLPTVSWNFNRVHQFGAGVPPDSGFNASHVPDQQSDRHSLAADWRGPKWNFGIRHDYSLQDNRQPGREQADFKTQVNAIAATYSPHARIDLNLELSSDRNESFEQLSATRTRNVGVGVRISATDKLQLTATGGLTRSADQPRTNSSENTFLDASLNYRLEWQSAGARSLSGQLFLRYSDRAQQTQNTLFGIDLDNRARSVVAGLTIGLR